MEAERDCGRAKARNVNILTKPKNAPSFLSGPRNAKERRHQLTENSERSLPLERKT